MKKLSFLLQCCLSSLLSLSLIFLPLCANSVSSLNSPISNHPLPLNNSTPSSPPIIIDPSSLNTSLDISANGVDILNIASPDSKGISNNLFLEFNVKENGLIFNNSTLALTPSLLGEMITANPNLINPASFILNQVTSTSASTLLGFMEIAGSSASLLIANPNGITCQGCGFINANDITLSTALPQIMDNGHIELNIQKGIININSLNALGSASLSLLAKSLSFNAELYANTLRAILGSNMITLDQKGSLLLWQPIQREDHSTSLALDVGYLGRVYASSIFMVASDEGVEAKIKGVMATYPTQREGDGGFYIDINGDLKISKREGENWAEENNSFSQENFSSNSLPNKQDNTHKVIQESLNINQGRFKENKGLDGKERLAHKEQGGENFPSLFSSSTMHIHSKTLNNEGYILSLEDASIQAQSLHNISILSSNQTLNLRAKEIGNTHGLIKGNNLVVQSEKIINSEGFILAKENAFIQANEILNRAKIKLAEQKVSQEHITIGRWKDYDYYKGPSFISSSQYLNEGDKDYIQTIYEDKIQSYSPAMFYAGNTLVIQAQNLENFDGQIGGEKESNLDVLVLNNHATQALRKVIKSGREAKHYTKRVKCGFFDFFTCGHKNVTAFGVFAYNPAAQITQINLSLPLFADSLSLSPNTQDIVVFNSYNPQNIKAKEVTEENLKDFILSDYFKQRLLSLSFETQKEFLTSLSPQERYAFISSLSKNDQNYLLKNFNNIHLDSFSSTLSLQNLPILLALNQRLNQELQNKYTIQNQQNKNFLLSLPSILNMASTSLSGNIAGESIYIQAKVLNNEGSIIASGGVFAQTKEKILNSGGIEAENITLNSKGEISNLGGRIKAEENLALNADSMKMSSSIYTQESYKEYAFSKISLLGGDETPTSSLPLSKSAKHLKVLSTQSQTLLSESFLSGKNITLGAKDTLSLSATKLNATNNLILNAKDITLSTQTLEQKDFRDEAALSSSNTLLTNSLNAKNIILNASNSLTSSSSSLQATSLLALDAKNISLLADKQENYSHSNRSDGRRKSSTTTSNSLSIINTLVGENILINASESVFSVGSSLRAKENLLLNAKDFTSLSALSSHSTSSSSSHKELFSSKGSSSSLAQESNTLAEFEAKNISLSTSEDMLLLGATLKAQEGVNITAGSFTLSSVNDQSTTSSSSSKDILWGAIKKEKGEKVSKESALSSSITASNLSIQTNNEDLNLIGSDLNISDSASSLNILNAFNTTTTSSSSYSRTLSGGFVDLKRKLRAGLKFKEKENSTQISQREVVASHFNVGSISLSAKDALNIKAANIQAEGEIQALASSITISSEQEVREGRERDREGELKVGVEIGNAYVDAYYAGKDFYQAQKRLYKAIQALKKAKQDYKEGKISKEALEDYKTNLALLSSSLLTNTTNLTSSFSSIASSLTSSYGSGFYAGGFTEYEGNISNSTFKDITQVSSSLSASSISFTSTSSYTLLSSSLLAQDIEINSGGEVKIEALANERTSNFQSTEYGVSLSFGTAGVNGSNMMGGERRERAKSVSYVASSLSASSLSINSGEKLTLSSSSAIARDMSIQAKELEVVSKSDTDLRVSKSFNGNGGVNGDSGSIGGGFGRGREEVSWLNTPSSLLASSSLSITLEDTLTLKGGVIGLGEEEESNQRKTERQGTQEIKQIQEIENKKSPTLFISAKSIKATHIKNTSKQESNGLNLSTSIGRSSNSLGIALSGNTELSLLEERKGREGVSYASIGSLNPKAEIHISLSDQSSLKDPSPTLTQFSTLKSLEDKENVYNFLPPSPNSSLTSSPQSNQGIESLQDQPSFSKDTILPNAQSKKDLQTQTSLQTLKNLGVNSNLEKSEYTEEERVERALNASLSMDNDLLSSIGRERIRDNFVNLGRNLAQIGRGLTNNILTQSVVNTLRDKQSNLIKEMYRYALIDEALSTLFAQEELINSLNGLTNLTSEQVQEVLNEVAQSASGEDGLNAPLRLYNNEEYTKGYAYSQSKEESKRGSKGASKSGSKRGDKREEWIGFNTLSNDLSKPHEVINTLFHETSNQALHRSNEEYANNRGNSAESIFSLKNYANSNTNLTTSRQWNERENHRERLRGGGVLREGNSYNARAYLGEWEGRGERENAEIRRRALSFDKEGKWEKGIDKLHHEHIFFEDEEGGNVGFATDWEMVTDATYYPYDPVDGAYYKTKAIGKFFTETDPSVIARYRATDGKHYDDAIMRQAVEDVKKYGMFKYYYLTINNCQDFIKQVKIRYQKIFKQQRGGK
ncbi:haemagglutinin [Helicobacter cholecystus]|nr:filamentous hemagglutinin N-terminal domain-containing protein [Helicobacter cholecystus]VEJ24402.1 haemagglutinin [Helicobacter cholecystus]